MLLPHLESGLRREVESASSTEALSSGGGCESFLRNEKFESMKSRKLKGWRRVFCERNGGGTASRVPPRRNATRGLRMKLLCSLRSERGERNPCCVVPPRMAC